MTKFIVFDRPEDTEPVVRLRLEQDMETVRVMAVNVNGGFEKYLVEFSERGLLRFAGAYLPGLPTDASGRIKLRD